LSLVKITDQCPLPRSCQRPYLAGAIYNFQYEGLFWRRAVLGGELLNLERPEMGSFGALFFCTPSCRRMNFRVLTENYRE